MELKYLRAKHPTFSYENYSWKIDNSHLYIQFQFTLNPNITFKPTVVIHNIDKKRIEKIDRNVIDNLVFHLGLIEIPSYWKAACSPNIVIKPGFLNENQKKWWKDLLIKGLGEFFYQNDIDFTQDGFVSIVNEDVAKKHIRVEEKLNNNRYLIPIGGGKDSVVTLRIFQKHKKEMKCLLLNPTPAALEVVKVAKASNSIIIDRTIDSALLELNDKGYLNGHTSFSAYLAFLFTLCAVLFDYKTIVVSNERSANEGNIDFHDIAVNHQYSKSFDFEKRFNQYLDSWLATSVSYISFLRPLYELQISKLFAKETQFFSTFKSCNVGRGKYWCNECPKCLFVYITLYPFISRDQILGIFKKDLFNDRDMLETTLELIGKRDAKPFECVGTHEESLVALYLSVEKYKRKNRDLPFILDHVEKNILSHEKDMLQRVKKFMNTWNNDHLLSIELEEMFREN